MLFGAAYYPEHRDPARWGHDLDMMQRAHVNALRVGEFAWSLFEPSDGQYDFAWMDAFAAQAALRGIKLLMCPPMRTLPAWMVEQDPSVKLQRDDGVVLEFGSRYSFCINHSGLREKARRLAEAMATHWGLSENILGWHLDNEHGDEPDCHCPICRAKFQDWCRARYGDVDSLNKAWGLAFWGLQFGHFGQVPTPRVTKTGHSPGHNLAWRRFRSQCTIECVELQASAVRKHAGKGQVVTTNNQPVWNPRTDYFEMDRHLDVAGTNYYPPYGVRGRDLALGLACVRGYKGGNFHVHELRNGPHMVPGMAGQLVSPGMVEKLTLHCVGNGADAMFYFRWRACPFGFEQVHGTITDYDGEPMRIYGEIQRLGERLKALAPTLAGSHVVSDVAMLYDFQTRWVMESHPFWVGPRELFWDRTKLIYSAVRSLGVSCDIVPAGRDWSAYKTLIVPLLGPTSDDLADRLVRYVEGGGTLIWHPLSGIKDEEAHIRVGRIHPRLGKLLGVNIREFATTAKDAAVTFSWQGQTFEGRLFHDLPVLEGAQATGEFTSEWFAGAPAVCQRQVGRGRVVYVATFADEPFYKAMLEKEFGLSGVRFPLAGPVPESLEVCVRQADDGRRILFLLNYAQEPVHVELPVPMADIYHGEPACSRVVVAPNGVRVLAPQA